MPRTKRLFFFFHFEKKFLIWQRIVALRCAEQAKAHSCLVQAVHALCGSRERRAVIKCQNIVTSLTKAFITAILDLALIYESITSNNQLLFFNFIFVFFHVINTRC